MPELFDQKPKRRYGCWYSAALILVALAVACYFAVCAISEAANRMHCANQICHIALAIAVYQQVYHSFPPAYSTDRDGRPLHSWRVLILPYLGCEEVYQSIRLNEPWNSPHNRDVFQKSPDPLFYFHCCSATNPESETSYVMIVGPNTISDGPHGARLEDIKDGCTNTIMFVEVKNSGIHWAEPRDLDFASMSFKVNDPNGKGVGSYHRGVAGVAFVSGSVWFIRDDFDPKLLKALTTINGGEDVSALEHYSR